MSSDQQPKRLTLEERLADAARKKKTSSKKTKSSPKPPVSNDTINQDVDDDKIQSENPSIVPTTSSTATKSILPDDYNDITREELESLLLKHINQRLKSSNDEISSLKSKIESKPTKQPQNSNMDAKLKQKDIQIEELMNEGIALSKKELTLNQSIKRLKKHELELENELEQFERTHSKLQTRCETLESQIESNNLMERALKEERELNDILKQRNSVLTSANEGLMDELKEFQLSQFDVQLESVKKELDDERQVSARLEVELSQTQKEANSFKISKLSIINSLETDNERMKQQIEDSSKDNEREIKRLEEKMENLRFQNENNAGSSKNLKEIDMLQAQFDQSQENWKFIESSYLKKIQSFENEIEDLKSLNVTLSKKNKILMNDLKVKTAETQSIHDNELQLQNEITSLNSRIADSQTEIASLNSNLESLTKDYESEKVNFENKLKLIGEEKLQLEETIKLRGSSNEFGGSNFYLQDLSSSTSSFTRQNQLQQLSTPFSANNKKFAIGFGESSTTPRPMSTSSFSRMNSVSGFNSMISPQEKILAHQNSVMSFDLDNEPLGIQSNSFRHLSGSGMDDIDELRLGAEANDTGSDQLSTLPGHRNVSTVGANNTQHIQLIKKLSSSVNRLEMELSTNKSELSKLIKERDDAGDEIMKLMDENKKVTQLELDLKSRDDDITSLMAKLDKVLVLLGEKEERVGELSADVDDLKDLLKQQVQQMVEMQMKINES